MFLVGEIPQIKLREFRAKARIVIYLRIDLTNFVPLYGREISALISEVLDGLARAIDSTGVTTEMITKLQEELAILQIALDDEQLKRITLNDLLKV